MDSSLTKKKLSLTDGVRGAYSTEQNTGASRGANQPRTKSVLGRGLSALMSASEVEVSPKKESNSQTAGLRPISTAGKSEVSSESDSDAAEGSLVYLALDKIHRNETQPRQKFEIEELDKLSNSIKKTGLLQPILVRKKIEGVGPLGGYEIVAGERRWRAAKQAGLNKIPAIIKQLDDKETLEVAIIENIQRSNLNPVEEARAYRRLINEHGGTQAELAETLGKDRASIANSMRLLKLPPNVQKLLSEKKISAGHGRTLLGLDLPQEQSAMAHRVVDEGLSVRVLEQLITDRKAGKETAEEGSKAQRVADSKSPKVLELEERLRRVLGTKVSLKLKKNGKGELKINFFSESELKNLLDKVGA